MNIQVFPIQETENHFRFSKNFTRNSTLGYLKEEIAKRWSLQPNLQEITFKGKKLTGDTNWLGSLINENNATVVVGFKSSIHIFIVPIDADSDNVRMEADLQWTVGRLKMEAARRVSRDSGHKDVTLILNEVQLDIDKRLIDLDGICDECEIQCRIFDHGGR